MASRNRPADLGTEYRQAFKAALDGLRTRWTTVATRSPDAMDACDTQYNLGSHVMTKADGDAMLRELDALKEALADVRDCAVILRKTTCDWMRSREGYSTDGDVGALNYG
jgi:hypothetical protein